MMFVKPATATDTIIMPYRHEGPAWSSYDAESGFSYTRFQSSLCIGGGVIWQGSTANADDGDEVAWNVQLTAGTWTLTILHNTSKDRAIADVYLDGAEIGSFDGYTAGPVYGVAVEFTGVAVAADGNYPFKLKADGKNASSTDYIVAPQWWCWTRTGA